MAVAMCDALPGALVEQFWVIGEKGELVKAPVRRRGYITKVKYPNETFDNTAIRGVWIKFDADKSPELMHLSMLNLVRKADEGAMQRMRRDTDNEAADRYNLDIHKSPVSDKTGVYGEKRMSQKEAESLK
jgi:hypothetical protein